MTDIDSPADLPPEQAEQYRKRKQRELIETGWPPRAINLATLGEVDPEERQEIQRRLTIGLPTCFWFQGPGGVGKTYAAVATTMEWMVQRFKRTARWTTGVQLFDLAAAAALPEELGWGLMVIDDFLLDLKPTKRAAARIEDLLRVRRERGWPTIVTTNIEGVDAVVDTFGGPILRILFGRDTKLLAWQSHTCRETGAVDLWRNTTDEAKG